MTHHFLFTNYDFGHYVDDLNDAHRVIRAFLTGTDIQLASVGMSAEKTPDYRDYFTGLFNTYQYVYPISTRLYDTLELVMNSTPNRSWIDADEEMPTEIKDYWCWVIPKEPFISDTPGYDDGVITPNFEPYADKVRTYRDREGNIGFNTDGLSRVKYWQPIVPVPEPTIKTQHEPR